MNTMIWPWASAISFSTAFSRSSNSPRYLEPATSAPRSSAITRRSRSPSGTSPETIRWASPSTIAVLPTPGSPISTGLFFVRRLSTWITRRISSSRPITGSSLPCAAASVRSRPYFSSAWNLSSGFWSVTRCEPRTSASALSSSSRVAPCERSASPAPPGWADEREQQVLGRDVLVVELAHLVLGGAQDLDQLARAAGRLTGRARQLRAARRARRRAPGARRPARRRACAAPGATTPPSCSSSTASRCSGVVCGLRRSSASRWAACSASWDLIVKRSGCIGDSVIRVRKI